MAAATEGEPSSKVRVPCARALHGFQGQSEHELNFSAGVSILLLRRIDENWLEGKLNGKIGIFPANYVKIEAGSPTVRHQSILANSGRPYAIALHNFQGTQSGDLTFNKGELIEIVGSVTDSAWIKGRLGTTSGIFPKSFVEILRYPEDSSTTSPNDISRRIPKPRVSPTKPHPLSIREVEGDASPSPPAVHNSPQSAKHVPTRSAPAPPTMRSGSRSTSHIGPVPQPRPRKPRPRHTSADATGSPSLSASSSSSQLESELEIEKKLLESAQGLLAASGQADGRSQKMKDAITSHKDRIQALTTQIEEVKETDEVLTTPKALPTATPPRPPPRPAQPLSSKDKQRIKVIEELVATERDFCRQTEFCVLRLIPTLSKVEGVQVDCLFGNMEEVFHLSRDLLAELEVACDHDDKKQARVGGVFTSFATRIKNVFGTYCRNHDSALTLYEKYMDTPSIADNVKKRIDDLRGEVQSFGLQSLLIKPVQRVLKYPLLLQQLIKNTSDKHPDYADIHAANTSMSKVAQDINEIKRRKDLVVKYTASKEERRGTMSFHSLQKKMRRFQQSLTQSAGLRPKTVDPKFDELEQKVLSLELLMTGLIKNITAWQEEQQIVLDNFLSLAEGMKLLCSTTVLSHFLSSLPKLQDIFKNQAEYLRSRVTSPLEQLEGLFHNPFVLIQKRKDKLLDFDRLQYQLDHSEDSEKIAQLKEEVLLAKRNYEALNVQLLEELPHLVKAATSTVHHLLLVLLQTQHSFTTAVAQTLRDLMTTCADAHPLANISVSSSAELQRAHAEELTVLCRKLTHLSLVPTSIASMFSLRAGGGGTVRRNLEVNKEEGNVSSPTSSIEGSISPTFVGRSTDNRPTTQIRPGFEDREYATPIPRTTVHQDRSEEEGNTFQEVQAEEEEDNEEEEDDEEEEDESQFPAKGTLLHVLYDFEAQDSAELSVLAGRKLKLLCCHDKLGCSDWWLVEDIDGERQGYVPATFMTFQPVNS